MITQNLYLEQKHETPVIDYMQGTTNYPLRFIFKDYNIPIAASIRAYIEKPSGKTVYQEATLTDENIVTVYPVTQSFIEPGRNKMNIQILAAEDIIHSFLVYVDVQKNPAMSESEESESYDYFLKGDKGDDGFSPVITTEETDDGYILTIVDAEGTSAITILNGEDGLDGEDGKDGQDGNDGKDGQDGAPGADGKDGTTFTPSVAQNGDLSWTNDGGKPNPQTVNIKGPQGDQGPAGSDGQDGSDGAPGADGVSPTVSTTTISGGHQVTITDKQGAHTFAVMDGINGQDGSDGHDGADGSDGFSPTVTVTSITGGHQVSITDAGGTDSFNVMDGEDGDDYVLTNQDKTDIANIVIANLPTWNGGNY